jgi:hypothetical protein
MTRTVPDHLARGMAFHLLSLAPACGRRGGLLWKKDGDRVQFAATFVEYLVTGTVALIWIVPLGLALLRRDWAWLGSVLGEQAVLLAIPVLYVVGMYVDSGASLLLKGVKRRIRGTPRRANRYDDTVAVLSHSPELAQELRALVSRDRVARGTTLNLMLAVAVIALTQHGPGRARLLVAAVLLSLVSLALWWRFDDLSREFKRSAVRRSARLE